MHHNLSIEEVFKNLETQKEGLSKEEASSRLEKYGLNKLPDKKKFSALALFLGQFKNPLIYILFVAFIISLLTGHIFDALIVLAVILVSSIVGFIQEYKANNALAGLKKLITYKARVLRNSEEVIILQEHIVPGDIILLSPGDKIPADARLISTTNFEVIEASLTGESSPSKKVTEVFPIETPLADRENMVYLGTVVASGKAIAVVTTTGEKTELGQVAVMVKEVESGETPLQKKINDFGKKLGLILIAVNVLIFLFGILMGRPLFEMFLTSVAVVVAAVPEGLLPAMTIILAIGMQKLAKHKGLVRKMLAAETLGSVSVICSDKTGTLTQGEMRVSEIITDGEASRMTALKIGLLCNNALIENPEDELANWKIIGDPTEKALLLAGRTAGLTKINLEENEKRIAEIPFNSEHKMMATLHKYEENKSITYAKGAPEKLLAISSFIEINGEKVTLTKEKKEEIEKNYERLTSSGLRVLSVGYKINDSIVSPTEFILGNLSDFIFVGLMAIKDPLRPEVKKAFALCRDAGIRPIIVTGDHKLTATAIVRELGILVEEVEK